MNTGEKKLGRDKMLGLPLEGALWLMMLVLYKSQY